MSKPCGYPLDYYLSKRVSKVMTDYSLRDMKQICETHKQFKSEPTFIVRVIGTPIQFYVNCNDVEKLEKEGKAEVKLMTKHIEPSDIIVVCREWFIR